MPKRPGTGRPVDKKGKYVRISKAAYEKIMESKREAATFIGTLDRLLKVK